VKNRDSTVGNVSRQGKKGIANRFEPSVEWHGNHVQQDWFSFVRAALLG